jgi:hypothetical protein
MSMPFTCCLEEIDLTPADLFDVATQNVNELGNDAGNRRLAVNAILTLDALAGIIHADLHRRGLASADDGAFRDGIAAQHLEYQILRDTAFALKHGELRGKKPRLVQRADQLASHSGAFDEAVFDRSAFDTEAVVWIEGNDATHSRRSDELTRAVLGIFQGMV